MDDITGDEFEQSDGEDDEEQAGNGTGKEFFAFFDLFGIATGGHNLNGGHEHDGKGDGANDTNQEGENRGSKGATFGFKGQTTKGGIDAVGASSFRIQGLICGKSGGGENEPC